MTNSKSQFTPRLTDEQYAASVVQVGKGRFHVRSSSKPSSVREVRLHSDGHFSCSCPARKTCCHITAVESFLQEVVVVIAEPVECGCPFHTTGNGFGCSRIRNNAGLVQSVIAAQIGA